MGSHDRVDADAPAARPNSDRQSPASCVQCGRVEDITLVGTIVDGALLAVVICRRCLQALAEQAGTGPPGA